MRKYFRKFLFVLLFLFIAMNLISAYHAYRFTHFTSSVKKRTRNPEQLSFFHKISVLISGVENPRPANDSLPQKPYQTLNLKGHDGLLSCWLIPKKNAKGTVILFHGYGACKSKLLAPSSVFDSLGYQTLLVDFMGCGSSSGNRTTIGYYEAEDVLAAFRYEEKIDSNIILFGSSMGASAILRAISVYQIHPAKIILECPYGSMVYATKNRFGLMGVPTFPMAYLLDFWGGIENGYWAFSQNCAAYACNVTMPTLLMRGTDDKYVSEQETQEVFSNLKGPKKLVEFDNTGHESYCIKDHKEWTQEINEFLLASQIY